MKGWMIFGHALQLVLGNRRQAARIAALPVAGLHLATWAILSASGFTLTTHSAGQASGISGGGTLTGTAAFLLCLIWLAGTAWIFVAWHRFVLLAEYPSGWVPAFHPSRILGYLGRMVMLLGLSIALMVPAGIVVILAASVTGGGVIALLLGPVGVLAVSVVIFRLSPVLPARAIGEFLTLRDVWQATRGTTGAIVAIVIIFLVLQMVMQLVAAIMAAILAPLGILAAYGVAVFSGLLAASLLTSFYGHFIEGRALR